jgi:hypothetical protein
VRVLGVLLVAACGAKAPPEPFESLPPQPASQSADIVRGVAMPRPEIDIAWTEPEFHEELRWPLSGMNHPKLEPRFPVAQELAIGLDWQQLCARGVHTRISATQKELLSYLHGWCDVDKRDVDAACAHLTPLLGSVTSGMRSAVRQDLANILVDQGNADRAEHWLSKHHVRDIATLDLLAANYVEVGSLADAFEINRRVIDSDDHATDATKCMRLVKRIVIGFDHRPDIPMSELKALAVNAKAPDPTCERLWNKIACWHNRSGCAGYYNDEGISEQVRLLADVYDEWPTRRATSEAWWIYADKARLALPAPGAAQLVVTAIEASVYARPCTPPMAVSFHHAIEQVRKAPEGPAFDARLQAIEKRCVKPEPIPAPTAAPPKAAPPSAPLSTSPIPNATTTAAPRPVAEWPPAPTSELPTKP